MDETNNNKRRERIKTILIFFLAILLVLTFFSNTIMNYSLPTVTTYNAYTAQITEKIRGNGTVNVKQDYKIKAPGSRKVSSIEVKAGDEIKKGDLIMVLDAANGNEAVETAEEALRTAEISYQKELLKAGPDYAEENTDIARSREDLQKAMDALNDARRSQSTRISENANKEAARKSADASAQQSVLREYLSVLSSDNYSDLPSRYSGSISAAVSSVASAQAAVDEAKAEVEALGGSASSRGDSGSSYTPSYTYGDSDASDRSGSSASGLERSIESKEIEVIRAREDYDLCTDAEERLAKKRIWEDKELELKHLREDLEKARAAEEEAQKSAEADREKQRELESAQENLRQANSQLTYATQAKSEAIADARKLLNDDIAALQKEIDAAKEITDAYTAQKDNNLSALEDAVTAKQRDLEDKIRKLSETKKKDDTATKTDSLDLESKRLDVEKKRKELETAREKSGTIKITAENDGIVKEVNVAVGDDAADGTTLATINLTSSGYIVEVSVTADQAKKLRIGTAAEIRGFYGDQKAILSGIKTDTADPKNKILSFDISGSDLTPGEAVELSITCSSQTYDLVVPNSAVRSDTKGSFVLVARSKSTPLGNRYYASRVEVKVLAKDDQYTAIQGDLGNGDAVIKTSEESVSAGSQVRLEDK